MNQPKLVHIFQAAKRMPRSRAVEQCIISLPEIRKNYSLLPLLKLQMLSLPGSVYGLALAAVLVQQIFSFTDLPLLEVLPVTGMLHAVIVLLFSRHLMLPGTGSMSEIEKCCRYSYGQILMARLLCLCVLTLTTFLIAMLPGVVSRQELGFLLPLVLPAACGALLALIWANYVSRSDIAQMTVYLVGALAVSMMQETIQEMGTQTVCAALLLIAAALVWQGKILMNRRNYDETYLN